MCHHDDRFARDSRPRVVRNRTCAPARLYFRNTLPSKEVDYYNTSSTSFWPFVTGPCHCPTS